MKLLNILFATLLLLATVRITSCSKTETVNDAVTRYSNEEILFWNEVGYEAFGGTQYQHSLMAARINAMMHLAMHDALNGIDEKYTRYAFSGKDANADALAAAATAAHTVLVTEIPARKSYIDSALAKSLSKVEEGEAKQKGINLGKQAGLAVISKRINDGSAGETFTTIPSSTQPGVYQAVPPFNILFAPTWYDVQLFSLERNDQFRSAPHPAINSPEYTLAFYEVKEAGRLHNSTRTADQTAFAKFWYEFSEAGWNRVTRNVVKAKNLDMLEAARVFALVDMAMADAYVAGWEAKTHYNFWRPYTAIRNAASDGNDATTEELNWEPCEATPPVHDYPSTHSALGNASATVLTKIFGNNMAFSLTSPTSDPVSASRSFNNFLQAADENAESRVMAGIHFRFSCTAGQEMGNKIGDWVVKNSLTPLR